jgi:hypothetical protein
MSHKYQWPALSIPISLGHFPLQEHKVVTRMRNEKNVKKNNVNISDGFYLQPHFQLTPSSEKGLLQYLSIKVCFLEVLKIGSS